MEWVNERFFKWIPFFFFLMLDSMNWGGQENFFSLPEIGICAVNCHFIGSTSSSLKLLILLEFLFFNHITVLQFHYNMLR